MRRAAFFDLDGTLLSVNSAALWFRREYQEGRINRVQAVKAFLFFLGYRLSLIDVDKAVTAGLTTIAGTEEASVRKAIHDWYRAEIMPLAAPGAYEVLEKHRARGDMLVLLTSSAEYTAELAKEQFGLDEILCTRYEVEEGRFTGRPVRPLCFGPGKVDLARELAAKHDIDLAGSSFYTDSFTDLPMLLQVAEPHVVNGDPRLRWTARRRGWPRLDWSRQPPTSGALVSGIGS
jgi:HAD superfamily hydrolase (TIGR01490 family)